MYTTLVSLKDKTITVPAVYLPFLKVVLADNESTIIAQTETSAVVNHFSDPKTNFFRESLITLSTSENRQQLSHST
jgi:hypothetical protein